MGSDRGVFNHHQSFVVFVISSFCPVVGAKDDGGAIEDGKLVVQ